MKSRISRSVLIIRKIEESSVSNKKAIVMVYYKFRIESGSMISSKDSHSIRLIVKNKCWELVESYGHWVRHNSSCTSRHRDRFNLLHQDRRITLRIRLLIGVLLVPHVFEQQSVLKDKP
ncbi:unnamed protein product [Larinioides sclopetarius]|uniref:Uncharacterized protein n=1 Tax=Larinioides sclopetarius TaxID=280406 RepID=A0AAV2BGG1_9ARAC